MYLLIIFLPFFTAFLLGFCIWWLETEAALKLAIYHMIYTLIFSFIACYDVILSGSPCIITLYSWIDTNSIQINFSFLFDTLTCIMLIVVNIISLCVHLYSLAYMKEDPHLRRFIAYLSLFTFFMLLLITANNLLQMFFGWEGVGLCSYLLINFWYQRLQANKAALKAIILNRIGDFGLSLGIFTIFNTFKTVDYSIIFALAPEFYNDTFIFLGQNLNSFDVACFFLFVGAVGKSAQIGLHTWLPDAMEGPTPVSALIHAATMVTAGIFLICRCSPLFQYAPNISIIITLLGCLTAFFAGTTGLVQNDLKRVIAYSTCSQLGYMAFVCGVSNYNASIFHLSNHAFFKAALFLSAGAVIHGLADEQDMRKMGATLNILYYTFITMTIGSLALKGFPFFAGFYSKDAILELTTVYLTIESNFAQWLGDFSAATTAFYSNRSLSRVFLGELNLRKELFLYANDNAFLMVFPLFMLSLGGFSIGYLTRDMFLGFGVNFWNNALFIKLEETLFLDAEFLPDFQKEIPLLFSFTGAILAFYLYNTKHEFDSKIIYNFKTTLLGLKLYTFLNRKWFFDKIYNENVAQQILQIAYKQTYQNIDRGLIELLGPTGISYIFYRKSLVLQQEIKMTFLFSYIFLILSGSVLTLTLYSNWNIILYFVDPRIFFIFFLYFWFNFSEKTL